MADDIFKSLQEAADSFLRNMQEASEGQKSTKEQLRAHGLISNPVPDDTFGQGLDRLKRLRASRPVVEPTATPEELMRSYLEPQQKEDASAAAQKGATPQSGRASMKSEASLPAAPSDGQPPLSVFSRFQELSQVLGKVYVITPPQTWTEMDQMSAFVRKTMASMLGQGNTLPLKEVLPSLYALANDVSEQSPAWGVHSSSWTEWANKWKQELPTMAQWLDVQLSPWQVPASFAPKQHSVPGSVKGVEELGQTLRDFDAYVQWWMQEGSAWAQTPAHDAFLDLQDIVEDFAPKSPAARAWKEKALDWLSITEGRLTVEEVNRAPKPVRSSAPRLK